jgi:hypothetical protein
MMVLQNCNNLEEEVRGSFGEISCDADEAMNIKAEEVSDAKEEEDPVTFSEKKVEPEVSCIPLCAHCEAGITNMQKCQLSFCSPSVCL